jgi:hypothetical protein
LLTRDELLQTAKWIASHQRADGAIPWFRGRKMDPWDHVHSAMGLSVAGFFDEARAAFRFLARTQGDDGAWPAASNCESVIDPTRETNHAAYLASGLWHFHCATADADLLAEMWPTLDRSIEFVVSMQAEDGSIYWATDAEGKVWTAPLLAGSASMYGSLTCAVRIAQRLGLDRAHWVDALSRLGHCIRHRPEVFNSASVPEPPGRYSMDWYYPVLGGALRGTAARHRLAAGFDEFVVDGRGCRCVNDREWYTVAETGELAIALEAAGMRDPALALLGWTKSLRLDDGGYWMGITYPNELRWPPERPAWTAATVILASDALAGDSATSRFFRDLEHVSMDGRQYAGDCPQATGEGTREAP